MPVGGAEVGAVGHGRDRRPFSVGRKWTGVCPRAAPRSCGSGEPREYPPRRSVTPAGRRGSAVRWHAGLVRRSRPTALALLAAAVLTALAACSAPAPAVVAPSSVDASATAAPPSVGAVPPGLERFYAQTLSWGPCAAFAGPDDEAAFADKRYDCARLEVPLDYADPDRPHRPARRAAPQGERRTKIGSLVVNPGGPGASGMSAVPSLFGSGAGAEGPLTARFDVVGLDPRGVGASTPDDRLPHRRRVGGRARRPRRRPLPGRRRADRGREPPVRPALHRARRRGRPRPRRHPRRRPRPRRPARRARRPAADLPRLLLRHPARVDLRRGLPAERPGAGPRRRAGPEPVDRRPVRRAGRRLPAGVRRVRGRVRAGRATARSAPTRAERPRRSRRSPARSSTARWPSATAPSATRTRSPGSPRRSTCRRRGPRSPRASRRWPRATARSCCCWPTSTSTAARTAATATRSRRST